MKAKGMIRVVFTGGRSCFAHSALKFRKDMDNYSTSHGVITWRNLAKVVTVIFADSRSGPNVAYIARIVTYAGPDLGSARPGAHLAYWVNGWVAR